jgi:hypothetical protein
MFFSWPQRWGYRLKTLLRRDKRPRATCRSTHSLTCGHFAYLAYARSTAGDGRDWLETTSSTCSPLSGALALGSVSSPVNLSRWSRRRLPCADATQRSVRLWHRDLLRLIQRMGNSKRKRDADLLHGTEDARRVASSDLISIIRWSGNCCLLLFTRNGGCPVRWPDIRLRAEAARDVFPVPEELE